MHAMILDIPGALESGVVHGGEVADPHPGPGQIVVRVVACGVCRSNLHMIEGDWVRYGVPAFTPIIPGHEVVGRVVEVGSEVDWLATRRPRRRATTVVHLRALPVSA